MPDSQENEWTHLGFVSEVEFNRSVEDWDEIVAQFGRAAESYRRIGPAVLEVSESFDAFIAPLREINEAEEISIRETEDMAVDIRHGEYPGRDSYGTYWYDPSGFHSDDSLVCFICQRPTHRVDIDFHGAFCNSEECNEVIRLDLERANGGPEVRD
ncbi:hypothetical protein SEA_EVY_235 [Streptomyces phage Evy]|uniref:Uncharacterized protein n=1 Tax=Streptomyces phage Evy TaxID=2588514 RepID=A0A514DKB3_9CAUD|nr:hypothetical protein KNU67_gp063 [Streptomyces phage Evy]QDH94069.1 hypothetical protein SEA_EVY_235 [Streptomyces phage Evy]UEM46992.1 hypothetical protein SEA_TARGARYEN_247 [Streptomyces phage Targaryen]